MLGHKLWQVLAASRETHVVARASYREVESLEMFDRAHYHGGVDLGSTARVIRVVQRVKPSVIVNCVGVVKQRAEAKDTVRTIWINGLFPHLLYAVAQTVGAHLVQVSTDCVFSGRAGRYTESDIPDPPDLYGRSKLLGEIHGPGCLTLRTSIIGRELRTTQGLVEWFLASGGGRVRGFAGAMFSGVSTIVLASMLGELLGREPPLSGLYHLAAEPVSKYELLLLLREAYGACVEIERDEGVRLDRSLVADRLMAATGLKPPAWPVMVDEMANDPTPYAVWRRTLWSQRLPAPDS